MFTRNIKALLAILALALISATGSAQTLNQPANEYSNFTTFAGDALTVFNGTYYLAWANSSNGLIGVANSTNGDTFSGATQINGVIYSVPSFAQIGSSLFLFYSDASNGTINESNSTDGVNWSAPVQVLENGSSIYTNYGVSATAFNGGAAVSYVDSSSIVHVIQTFDGHTVSLDQQVNTVYPSTSIASIAVVNNVLVLGYQASNHYLVMSGYNPQLVTPWQSLPYPNILIGTAPSLTNYVGVEPYGAGIILVSFRSDDKYNVLVQTTGTTWDNLTSPAPTFYDNILMGSQPNCVQNPGNVSVLPGYSLLCAFRSNDQYNLTFIAHGQ